AGRPREAEREYRAAVELLRRWGPEESVPEGLGRALASLAIATAARDVAAALNLEAVDQFERLSRDFPSTPRYRMLLARALHNQSLLWDEMGRWDEQERTALRSLELRRAPAAAFPNS